MSEALEGEIIPAGTNPTPTDQLDPDAIELGRVDRGGRPTDMTPEVVTKLIAAFNNMYNITEACQYADISRTTYYRWIEKDDRFSYKMSQAQSAPTRKAKEIVVDGINKGDTGLALRLLMLKDPDFKPKATLDAPEGQQRTEDKLKEFLDDINDGAYPDTHTEDDVSAEPVAEVEPVSRGEVAQSPTDIS